MKTNDGVCRWTALTLAACACGLASAGTMREDFASPPRVARPHVWWHWMGSNVSRDGIARDLKAMAESGIGGATVFNIKMHGADDADMENAFDAKMSFRNDEYWSLLKFAADEAKKQGIELTLHNCPGFSVSGGPWIGLDRAMCQLTWAKGPELAKVPSPYKYLRYGDLPPVAVTNAAGKVTWYRFAWTATGRCTHPTPSEIAGKSYEVDKLSAEAVNFHLDNVLKPLRAHLGDHVGTTLKCIAMDSYEGGSCSWTPGIFDEFRRRRGYDPRPWLPALAGDPMPRGERFREDWQKTVEELFTENHYRVLAARIHAEGMLFHLEPYGGPFDRWEAAAYADFPMVEFWLRPYRDLRSQFGGYPSTPGAVGRALGRRVIGTEAFTAFPGGTTARWCNSPRDLKENADGTYARGVNRLTLHHWVHQPFPAKWQPGMTMGQWGTHFGENQTWHRLGKAFYAYLGRCQALLQRGEETVDRLALKGDPGGGTGLDAVPESVFLNGLEALPNGDVRVRSSGRRYRLLEIPASMTAPSLAVARKVKELVDAGAHVNAPAFARARGLSDYPASDREVAEIAKALKGKTGWTLAKLGVRPPVEIVSNAGRDALLWNPRSENGTNFYFVCNCSSNALAARLSFRTAGRAPSFWHPEDGSVAAAESWKVEDGRTVVDVPLRAKESVFVVFDGEERTARGSVPTGADGGRVGGVVGVDPRAPRKPLKTFKLGGLWSVTFQKDRGAPEGPVAFDGLGSLTASPDPRIRHFAGEATYVKHLDVWQILGPKNVPGAKRYVLDLGDVREICSVKVNGIDFGTLWHPPYRVDVTEGFMKLFRIFDFNNPKRNSLDIEICVATTWRNRLIGDHLEPDDCNWRLPVGSGRALRRLPDFVFGEGERPSKGRIGFTTFDYFGVSSPLVPSGLVGPVTLEVR